MVEKAVEAEAEMHKEQEIVRAERAKNKVRVSLLFCRRLTSRALTKQHPL
jgi:hypothetical protein